MRVFQVEQPAERSRICERILSTVPEWFGIESANAAYIEGVSELPTFVALADDGREVGLLAVTLHGDRAAEIWLMAVVPELHRRGTGRRLVEAAERYLAERSIDYLQVKTLGPSDPDEGYARTRAFYEALGFVALEELHGLWEANPCLLLVKRLP